MSHTGDEHAAYGLGYPDEAPRNLQGTNMSYTGGDLPGPVARTIRVQTKDGAIIECFGVYPNQVENLVAKIATQTLAEFQAKADKGMYTIISRPVDSDALSKAAGVISEEHTGLSVNYYQVAITNPTTPGRSAYTAECNDIIEALNMPWPIANVFKACWRIAASVNLGLTKKGNSNKYDAEKIVFYGDRILKMFSKKEESMKPK